MQNTEVSKRGAASRSAPCTNMGGREEGIVDPYFFKATIKAERHTDILEIFIILELRNLPATVCHLLHNEYFA